VDAFDGIDTLPFLVTLLAALGFVFLLARAGDRVRHRWARQPARRVAWALALAFVALATGFLALRLPELLHPHSVLSGDAASHARVAQEIAQVGLPRGWIGSYSGGFPFGPHYQSGALLTAAALIRLGLDAVTATKGVGLIALLLVPLTFLWGARALGATPLAATLGALVLGWMESLFHFVGGLDVMLVGGLVSQAFATPLCLFAAFAVLSGRPRGLAPLLAALAICSHAQIALCAFAASAPAMLFARREQQRRYLIAALAAAVAAAAHYGAGARHFALPFSWADVPEFSTLGFGAERLPRWLVEGALLDHGRVPLITALVWFAAVVALARPHSAACKGVLTFFTTATVMSVAGVELAPLIGRAPFELFSPVRMMCIVPFAAAALVVVVMSEIDSELSWRRWLWEGWAARALALTALTAFVGIPHARAAWRAAGLLEAARLDGCARQGFAGFRDLAVSRSLASSPGGRTVVMHESDRSVQTPCPVMRGVELGIDGELGLGTGGPGSQLGVIMAAFAAIKPDHSGAAERAEALAVRRVLHPSSLAPQEPAAWRRLVVADQAVLSERVGGRDEIGVGCIVETWRGPDRALRDALFRDLRASAPVSLHPTRWIGLEEARGDAPVERVAVSSDDCDPSGAELTMLARGPGDFHARLVAPAPVDVVIRATFLPTWDVRVDGVPTPHRLVAPGFVALRVAEGDHQLTATAHGYPHYAGGLVIGAMVVLLLAAWEYQRARRLEGQG
jgi:hypothetical protein